jgi:hypothetical protein
MEGVMVLAIGACLSAGVAVLAWLAHAGPRSAVPVGAAAVPAAAARRTASWRLVGVIMGLAAGGAAAASGMLGRGLLLAGPVSGLCVLVGVMAGEISVRPAGGQIRAAVVEVRRVRDYLLVPVVALIGWCAGVLLAPARAVGAAPPAR